MHVTRCRHERGVARGSRCRDAAVQRRHQQGAFDQPRQHETGAHGLSQEVSCLRLGSQLLVL